MSAKSDMSQLVRMIPLAVVIPSIASLGMVSLQLPTLWQMQSETYTFICYLRG